VKVPGQLPIHGPIELPPELYDLDTKWWYTFPYKHVK
jgi:hypothetical protein